ncbi:MAG: hydrogenase maturation protease [Bacteroidetes bacterium]|nr:hydrogenase maturation protease [Bacteroidota bacterium]
MKPVLVIGYGNTLRSDDGAGVRAAEIIAQRMNDINVLCVHQLTPELAESLAEASLAFFLDAEVGSTTLTISTLTPQSNDSNASPHSMNPQSLLAMSLALYGSAPKTTYLIGIPAYDLRFSETLSSETSKWIEPAVEKVISLIQSFFS